MVAKIGTKLLDTFSRSVETVFFMLLYNQIVLKTSELFENEDVTNILKEFGSEAAIRSCKRHPTVLKFAPKANELDKIVELIEFLWVVAFGRTPEFTYEILEDSHEKKLINLKIFECPVCSGIDQNDLNLNKLEHIHSGNEKYSCMLTGMIEGATRFLMGIQDLQNYEIQITETDCILDNGNMEMEVNFYKK